MNAAIDLKGLGLELKGLAQMERNVSLETLLKLKTFDEHCGWHFFNCRSLFEFCMSELKLLACATWFRVHAVKILGAHPEAADYLRDGRLTMTTLVQLRSVLGTTDATALLERCAGKSGKKVARIVAELEPREGPATSLRRYPLRFAKQADESSPSLTAFPPPATEVEVAQGPSRSSIDDHSNVTSTPTRETAPPLILVAPLESRKLEVKVRPVNARDYALNATVDQDFVDLLERLTDLMSHSIPSGEPIEVIRRAMQIAVDDKLRQKAAQAKRPRRNHDLGGDGIPAAVRRAVWERDGGCCTWTYEDGHHCRSRWMLEFDHIVPCARGGLSTIENVRLLCRDHNTQHARDAFGVDFIQRKRARD